MSTFQNKRCGQCGVRYAFQTSGYGGLQANNDPNYCSNCYQVIQVALAAVPPRSVRDWMGTSDVSVEALIAQEEAQAAEAKALGQLPVRRVLSPLFDLTTPDNQQHQGIVRRDGRTYRYEYWTLQGDKAAGRVWVEVERDAQTGEILGPWNLSDRWAAPPTFIEHSPWPDRPKPTHEFVPMPMSKVRRFALIESQSLADIKPVHPTWDYTKDK